MAKAKSQNQGKTKVIPNNPTQNTGNIKSSQPNVKKEFFDSIDSFFDKHLSKFFWISFILSVIFGYLLFDMRVSLTGDDSGYIIRASRFVKNFDYPSYQGPLYPVVLAPFVWLFGIKLVPLKIVSFFFVLGFLYFFYRTFRKRISSFLLSSVMILISLNAYILYYSSQTYSEAFFMLIQALLIMTFFKYFVDNENKGYLKENYKKYLIIGLLIVLLGLTRSVGLASLAVIGLFLIMTTQWRQLLYIFLSFFLFFALFQGIKSFIGGGSGFQFEGQGSGLLLKNYYNPQEGYEDFSGFITRLIDNSDIYISRQFFLMLGLRPDDSTENISLLTALTYILYIPAVFFTFRKNKYLLFSALYGGIFCITTFLIIQTSWGQGRLIVPYIPYIILAIFTTAYYLFKLPQLRNLQFLVLLIPVILIFSSLGRISDKVKFTKNIDNKYYGLSPDWVNYGKMSEWAGKNLPKDSVIACRKPSISYIYANGREFYGIVNLPTWPGQDLLNYKNDSSTNMLFDYGTFSRVSNMDRYMMSPYLKAFISNDSLFFYMFSIPKSQEKSYTDKFKAGNIAALDAETVKNKFQSVNKSTFAVYPDSLLDKIKRAKVKYVLDASLRKYPNEKTDQTINTVFRYISFIEMKYPGIFKKISQMGGDNEEPATLYEINYSIYNK